MFKQAMETKRGGVSTTRETPYGKLYELQPQGTQIALLICAFVGGPALGWLMQFAIVNLSDAQQIFLCIPLTLVFFFGYALWSTRIAAITFDTIGKSILRGFFAMILKRKKPDQIADLLPDRDKLEKMAVRVQKAGWSFLVVAVLVGIPAAVLALFLGFGLAGATMVLSGCLLWGYVLGRLARRGYLPFAEPS